jgi:hypothetical protein
MQIDDSVHIYKLFSYIAMTCKKHNIPTSQYSDMFREGILSQASGNLPMSEFIANYKHYLNHLETMYSKSQVLKLYKILHKLPTVSKFPTIDKYENISKDTQNRGRNPYDEESVRKAWIAGFLTARIFS